ncbi:TIGR01457 family HAD-type hydrolase [Tuberibacillus calidus]|uniref:TIGR01457 family HAD-type hydrolase n=1 Tax=Tuberibacillus calidus TaxID=340097 RepID=UPI0004252451|nr:TIGR01457 family HAD-type hydrolase [Tuberibacillus calidus]
MKKYQGYLFDLDGTVYRGREPIPGAVALLRQLKASGIPYMFVTNNSTKTPEDVAQTLTAMDIPCTAEDVITSSMALAGYLQEKHPEAKVYVIGENGLWTAVREAGFTVTANKPDYVAVGMDRQLTYEKLAEACLAIRGGATFLSTNPDVALPTERGLLPGNGSITALLQVATGVTPIFIGKPEPIIIRQALERLGLAASDVLMVGDNYQTDILAGLRAGVDTLFVQTGVTTAEELAKVDEPPTYTVASLAEWRL